ncbi:MAG TPA: hypothetical protein VEW45_01705 [Candidatus Dormibacteraeota bacterium]|nr:hypothetical protein [Candidatus Dormibacteraeota bacterium]
MLQVTGSRLPRLALAMLAIAGLLLALVGSISTVRAGGVCPEDLADRVSHDESYTITRGTDTITATSLDDVQEGDSVEIHFVVAEGCTGVGVYIFSYTASGNTHETMNPQKLFDKDEGTFDAGTHALGPIDVPDCFFQVDVVIKELDAEGEETERFILDANLGGDNACVDEPTPEEDVEGGTPVPAPEEDVQGSTGTPAASLPNSAVSLTASSVIAGLVFGVILLTSLGTLAWRNVRASGRRR